MTTLALNIRNAAAITAAALGLGASLVFGSAGTAHAHGTFTVPQPVPRAPLVHGHHGPFSVLHQGPFSVLRQAR
ncbi:hypothetical protein [Mycobacterium sp.]|uniref:hypothetical protein n=1 Tax=Mycobacterium sp. TaxID=1785 RepID=UPI003D11A70C